MSDSLNLEACSTTVLCRRPRRLMLPVMRFFLTVLLAISNAQAAPSPPVPNSIAASTASNPYTITGTASLNIDVRLYVNNVFQSVIKSSASNGSFSFKAALYDGVNTISATTWDGTTESAASGTRTISYTNAISRTQGGYLSTDTVWTPGTPYVPYLITSSVVVGYGVVLTLQPGVELQFSGVDTMLSGNVVIRGTPTSKVKLTSAGTLAPAAWSGVSISSGTVDNAIIEYAYNGVQFDSGSTGTISNSIIRNNVNGIEIYSQATPYIGPGNVITANTTGISVDGGWSSNSVSNNPNPVVTGNAIYANSDFNFYTHGFYNPTHGYSNPSVATLDARYNWWGTTSPSDIVYAHNIYSYTNSWDYPNTSALVDYRGYLNAAGGVPVEPNALSKFNPITTDTTLIANTTYELLEDVVVPLGVTLTIPAGVTLHSTGGSLIVKGALLVQGTAAAPVTFTSIATPVAKNNWNGIKVDPTATKVLIDHAVIKYGSFGISFSSTAKDSGDCLTLCLQNSVLDNNATGLRIGNATAQNNIIQNNTTGISVYPGVGRMISNTIQNNSYYGIDVYSGANPAAVMNYIIQGNTILNNSTGIVVEGVAIPGGSIQIKANTVQNNSKGIFVAGDLSATITGANIIIANRYGIFVDGSYGSGQSTINGNSIYANTTYNYYTQLFPLNGTAVLNARNNWWGSVDPVAISGTIYDYTDNSTRCPVVDFGGFLQSAGGAPVSQNTLGAVMVDTTLSANTTYTVLGNLRIAAGKTLTIPPGAVLQFGGYNKLLVEGALIVQGTSACPVRFTSTKTPLAKSSWIGIEVSSTASKVVIDGAVIEYAEKAVLFNGPTLADNGSCSVLCVKNSLIQNNLYGLYLAGATKPSVMGNRITSNTYAIYLLGTASDATSPSAVVTGNDIFGNNIGLYAYNYGATSSIVITATGNWWGVSAPLWGSDVIFFAPVVVDYSNAAPQSVLGTNQPPTVALTGPANNSVFYAPAIITLSATAADSDGKISNVRFFNGSTLLSKVTASPYGFVWNGVVPGTYTLTAKANDNKGAVTTSTQIKVTVKPITLTIDAAVNGAVINDDHMLVSGSFTGPANTGVTVNGILATSIQNGTSYLYYANNVPLNAGSNTLTANLVSQDGQIATASATVTSNGAAGYRFVAHETEGMGAPFTTQLDYANNTTQIVQTLRIDWNGDGTFDYTLNSPPSSVSINVTNSSAGAYPMQISLLGTNGAVLYTSKQAIVVQDPMRVDTKLKAIWTGMLDRLRGKDVNAALTACSSAMYDKYSARFTSLGTALPPTVDSLGAIQGGSLSSEMAEYTIVRTSGSNTNAFLIYLIRGDDGIWRVDSM